MGTSDPPPHAVGTRVDVWLWLVAVVSFGIGDVATTAVGLQTPGVTEMNPFSFPHVRQNGLLAVVVLKSAALGATFILWLCVSRPVRVVVPIVLSVVGVSVTVWNLGVLILAAGH